MLYQVSIDSIDQIMDTGEGASSDGVDRDVSEEALDHVEPRSAGRCEVEVEPGVLFQPRHYLGMFVGGVIVANDVDFFGFRGVFTSVRDNSKT